MFQPPFCPNPRCSEHQKPRPNFYIRCGFYKPICRAHSVPRFRCRSCNRGFSRQTFRADYRDHKPHLNTWLFKLLASGVGLRQSARTMNLSVRSTELKARKIGRHLRRLNSRVNSHLSDASAFHFDEIETFEGQRNTRPLTVPVLIESESRFIIWSESGTIRPSGSMPAKRRLLIESSNKRYGKRSDQSKQVIRRTLQRGARMARQACEIVFHSDEKLSYPGLVKRIFGSGSTHIRTNSQVARTLWNPLFPINHEEAVMRDLMGRLRRRSWLASKKRRFLDIALHVHIAYRNLIRSRFNTDVRSSAQLLGLMPRRLSFGEALGWRQELGNRSIHPLSLTGRDASKPGWKAGACAA